MKNHGGLSIPVSKEGDRENFLILIDIRKEDTCGSPMDDS